MGNNDPIRRSGEYRVEQNLGEILQQIHGAVEKRLDTIVEDFKDHAEKVNSRLAQGDTTMAVMNQTIKSVGEKVDSLKADVTTQVSTLREEIRSQSDRINGIEKSRPADRTPRATPALTPKEEPKEPKEPWLYRALRKGAEVAIAAVMTAIILGIFWWIIRGNAAKVLDSPTPPTQPTSSHPSMPPATGTPQ